MGDGDSTNGARTQKYDLAERTAQFGEAVIAFVRKIKLDSVTSPLVKQLVRSATSVGANYAEADEAGSKKEFRYRISVCTRESRETKHWLRMMAVAEAKTQGRSPDLVERSPRTEPHLRRHLQEKQTQRLTTHTNHRIGHWSLDIAHWSLPTP